MGSPAPTWVCRAWGGGPNDGPMTLSKRGFVFGMVLTLLGGFASAQKLQVNPDPLVAECGVARMWNWAMGKTDIVDTLQEVPSATIQAQVEAFKASGFKMKDLIYAVYTSEDFVKF